MLILVLKIENIQHDYARCMELIHIIEERASNPKEIEQYFAAYTEEARGYFSRNGALKKVLLSDIALQTSLFGDDPRAFDIEIINECEKSLLGADCLINNSESFWSEHFRNNSTEKIYYYFRVKCPEYTDVAEVFYYSLMQQATVVPNNRMAICFFPPNDNKPFGYGDYSRFSLFIQNLSKINRNYYIYANLQSHNKESDTTPWINKLALNEGKINEYFPITEINSNTFEALTTAIKLVKRNVGDKRASSKLAQTISAIVPEGKVNWLTKFAFDHAAYFITLEKGNNISDDEKINAISDEILNFSYNNGITALHYLMFSTVIASHFDEMKKSDIETIRQTVYTCLSDSLGFADGVMQILENIIHHSSEHKGLFAMRLHKNKDHFDYLSHLGTTFKSKSRYLQVLMGDVNLKSNITSTFLTNYPKEAEALSSQKDQLRLSDFFGEWQINENAFAAWDKFHSFFPAKCTGLPKFANAMKLIHAVTRVRSSTDYNNSDLTWNRDFSKSNVASIHTKENAFIPGTQYEFVTSMMLQKQDLVSEQTQALKQIKAPEQTQALKHTKAPEQTQNPEQNQNSIIHPFLSETYKDCALWLSFKEINPAKDKAWQNCLSKAEKVIKDHPDRQARKDLIWSKYRLIWDKHLRNNKYFIINMDDYCTKVLKDEIIEGFCKGFLDSNRIKGVGSNAFKSDIHLIFQNCNNRFFTIFKNTVDANKEYILAKPRVQLKFVFKKEPGKTKCKQSPPVYIGGNSAIVKSGLKRQTPAIAENEVHFHWESFGDKQTFISLVEELTDIANRELAPGDSTKRPSGFCLKDTHLKLGSKVHVNAFYEVAPYLMRQDVAKAIAFYWLRKLINTDRDFCQWLNNNERICFYGYSLYSRAIVNAMYEMVWEYRKNKCKIKEEKPNVYFIIYQTPQAGDEVDNKEQVYFSDESLRDKGIDQNLKIIQIVPIATTCTTFEKHWDKLMEHQKKKDDECQCNGKMMASLGTPYKSFAAYWIRSSGNPKSKALSTNELPYFKNHDPATGTVTIRTDKEGPLKIKHISYIAALSLTWQNPLSCEWCYPSSLGKEQPLVVTDDSSTVPSQQYYRVESKESGKGRQSNNKEALRIAQMYDYIKYGHISRAASHYQYYIDMQGYFRQNKDSIREWLNGESAKTKSADATVYIISPQKPNNIEFSQCVNDHCFNGMAQMIHIQSDKHFRSNVSALYEEFFIGATRTNAQFVYADTDIGTGQTFRRIESLMESTVSQRQNEQFLFDHVFVLVNRLSLSSRKAYARSEDQFHAYANLFISNMRTYGDSCVGCKLKTEIEREFKDAATRELSEYLEAKITKNDIVFHEHFETSKDKIRERRWFLRMLCSHDTAMRLNNVRGKSSAAYFGVLKKIFLGAVDISCLKSQTNIQNELDKNFIKNVSFNSVFRQKFQGNKTILDIQLDAKEALIVSCVKVLSRPFFTYDFKLERCVADILMFSVVLMFENFDAEKALNKLGRNHKDKPAFSAKESKWRNDFALSLKKLFAEKDFSQKKDFLLSLLKSLANMRMNFVYRKEVIEGINTFLLNGTQELKEFKDFYKHYITYILRVVKSSDDEYRALRLEYLLMEHREYDKDVKDVNIAGVVKRNELCKAFGLKEETDDKIKNTFLDAARLLYVENNSALLRGIRDIYKHFKVYGKYPHGVYMRTFFQFVNYVENGKPLDSEDSIEDVITTKKDWLNANRELYAFLMNGEKEETNEEAKEKQSLTGQKIYKELHEKLKAVAQLYYPSSSLTLASRQENSNPQYKKYIDFETYFSITAPDDKAAIDPFKSLLINKDGIDKDELERFSFHVDKDGNGAKIIIKFQNNYAHMKKELKNITHMKKEDHAKYLPFEMKPVYILIMIPEQEDNKTMRLVRNLLMYRHDLITWFEKDFRNDTMAYIAQISRTAGLLVTEKAGDHSHKNDLDFLQYHLHRQPWPDELPLLNEKLSIDEKKQKLEEFVLENESEAGWFTWYVNHSSSEIGYQDKTAFLLLHSYVNAKIGRLYRTMVDCDALDHPLKLNHIYRRSDDDISDNRAPLSSLSDVFNGVSGELKMVYHFEKNEGTIDLGGLSRKYLMELLMKAFQFHVEEAGISRDVEKPEDLGKLTSTYKFIKVDIQDEENENKIKEYRYCSEHFFCLFLDFCYSAMKHCSDWDVDNSNLGGIGVFYNKKM